MTNEELQQMFAETARIRELANPAAVPYSDFQVPTSNVAPSSFASNLGGLLFGGADSGLNEYLSREQQKQMQSQALMSAAMSLLKNSGYTTRPIGLGEALGSAYEAGTAGYQGAQKNAIEQMLTKQKLDEYKRQVADEEAYRNMFTQMPTAGAPMTPTQALSVGGGQAGPTPQRAAMIGQPTPAGVSAAGGMPALTQVQMDILRRMPAKEGRAELLKLMQPPAPSEKTKLLNELGLKPTLENLRLLDKPEADPEKIQYLKALNMPITLDNLRQLDKPEALPSEIQILKATNMPITFQNVQALRRSGATTVNVNEGQKGFDNEMSLGKAFKAEPIYKDFNDMKSAFSQVISSFKQGTPIGDVAGATKIMKLLDPGSVVRESELAIAMQAGGRLDRLQNYFSLWASGEKLTPTQRDDFQALANELYAAAGQAYNQKRAEYENFGRSYGFKNLDTALGGQATLPSIVRKPPAGKAPPASATPPSIQDILNKYPARTQ
jgi:hypothetical protein